MPPEKLAEIAESWSVTFNYGDVFQTVLSLSYIDSFTPLRSPSGSYESGADPNRWKYWGWCCCPSSLALTQGSPNFSELAKNGLFQIQKHIHKINFIGAISTNDSGTCFEPQKYHALMGSVLNPNISRICDDHLNSRVPHKSNASGLVVEPQKVPMFPQGFQCFVIKESVISTYYVGILLFNPNISNGPALHPVWIQTYLQNLHGGRIQP